jgi:hypothetical protein
MILLLPSSLLRWIHTSAAVSNFAMLNSCEELVRILLVCLRMLTLCVLSYPTDPYFSFFRPANPIKHPFYPLFSLFALKRSLYLVSSHSFSMFNFSDVPGRGSYLLHCRFFRVRALYSSVWQRLMQCVEKLSTSFSLHTAGKKLNHSFFFYSNVFCWK